MMLTSFSISDKDRIPNTQGIYAFYLDLISPVKLGLVGKDSFATTKLQNARMILKRRTRKAIEFARSSRLTGKLQETRAPHMAETYAIEAKEQPPLSILDMIDKLPDAEIYHYVSVLRSTVLFSQPIYVGIAIDQTLKCRYHQHMQDFAAATLKNSFGTRLRESGFDWDDVVFSCKEIIAEDRSRTLSLLEKYLQCISSPILSLR